MAALFTIEQNLLTEITLVSSGASLANGANSALSSALNNVAGGTSTVNGYKRGKFRFSGSFGSAPNANGGLSIYAIQGDSTGTTYETSNVAPPPNIPIATIAMDATNTTQVRDSEDVDLPAGYWKILVYNNGTGQTVSSTWVLTLMPITDQGW